MMQRNHQGRDDEQAGDLSTDVGRHDQMHRGTKCIGTQLAVTGRDVIEPTS